MEVISVSEAYASGVRRLVAWFIDKLILGAVLTTLFAGSWDEGFIFDWWTWENFTFSLLSYKFIKLGLVMLYYAFMESSRFQATLGKVVMGIKVTDQNGHRLDFAKALLRNLSKIISGIVLGIGYLMIVFDDKKQGLHDKIADTYVVRA